MAERTYIIGQSGSGKSTLLKSLIRADRGGYIVLDPHGDVATELADAGLADIFWEPARTIIGFNPIKNIPIDRRHLVASNITASFKNIYGDSWGPRLEWILYNSILLLTDNNGNLTDIPRLLTDDFYRAKMLRKTSAPAFWDNEFDAWERRQRNEAISPVLNKIGPLVINPTLRDTLSHSTISLKRIMDSSQRLVVDLSKGKLGEQASHLLGALIVSAVTYTAQNRAAITFEQRRPFTLYADEFQNFATEAFAVVLSEARKYRLSICIAHQNLGQLTDSLRQSVFGNVNRFVSFKIGAEDAPLIAPELGLHTPETLVDLQPFERYERRGLDPEYFAPEPPPALPTGKLTAVRNRTRSRYAARLA